MSTLRLCTVAGLAAGTAAAGLAFAPTALASPVDSFLPPLEGSDTAVIGQPYVLTGTDCVAPEGEEAIVYVDFLVAADVEADPDAAEPVLSLDGPVDADGTWTATATFSSAATPGEYVVWASCEPYADVADWYPDFSFTLEAAPAAPTAEPTTPAKPTVAPTGQIRGTAANTPGVASPDSGGATGDTAAPGQKVVKILSGFKPGEKVTVTLHSAPQTVATATADTRGYVRVEFTLPAGTPAGAHTLVYEGDQGTYFQEAFTVTAASGTGSGDHLAYTGASIALPLGLGAGALALGGGLVLVTRRRAAGAAEAAQV
ncbi:hypothetical protein [Geodermatophilus saharensis]|uniref:hypothetical protein n=1 Tax=Geodermatophilus saharensis TaxID=1137994 RepID=UPI001C3E8505|nr:hypothetical protein [Geodermatophilus saharensis]